MSGEIKATFPKIGSIWRENDSRFTRHVRVVGIEGALSEAPAVLIQTVGPGLLRLRGTRVTRAKATAFGKRYLPAQATATGGERG